MVLGAAARATGANSSGAESDRTKSRTARRNRIIRGSPSRRRLPRPKIGRNEDPDMKLELPGTTSLGAPAARVERYDLRRPSVLQVGRSLPRWLLSNGRQNAHFALSS